MRPGTASTRVTPWLVDWFRTRSLSLSKGRCAAHGALRRPRLTALHVRHVTPHGGARLRRGLRPGRAATADAADPHGEPLPSRRCLPVEHDARPALHGARP